MSFPGSILGGKLEHFLFWDTFLGLKDPRMRRHMTETWRHMTEACQWPRASSPAGSCAQAGRDDLDPPPEVGSRPGGVPALQKKKRKKEEDDEKKKNKAASI